MRILIKTIIIVITIFVLLMVYGLFSMNYGFASSINNVEWDIFTIKNLKILEIGNSCFISFETISDNFYGLANKDDALILAIYTQIANGKNYTTLSFWPLVIGVIVILVTIFFPKFKTSNEHKNTTTTETSNSGIPNQSAILDKNKKSHLLALFMLLVCLAIVITAVIAIIATTNHNNKKPIIIDNDTTEIDTSLNNSNFTFELNPEEVTIISIYYTVTPNVNVEYVKYQLTIYDDDNTVIDQFIITKSNLSANTSYKDRIEVGVVNYFKTEHVTFQVIEGKKAL